MAKCAHCGKGLLATDRKEKKCGRCGYFFRTYQSPDCSDCKSGNHNALGNPKPFCGCCRRNHVKGAKERTAEEVIEEARSLIQTAEEEEFF